MTLSTNILVFAPVDAKDLHTWINVNLLEAPDAIYKETGTSIRNQIGQGFAAIAEVDHNAGEPWPLIPATEDMDTDDLEDLAYENRRAGAFANVYFDTSYGYSRDGMGCTELHASYIVRLAREYFEPRGIPFRWQNEYSGEWTDGLDPEGMSKFLGGGDDAMAWFSQIMPVISAEIAAEGGTVVEL